jgi:hypothetical protein
MTIFADHARRELTLIGEDEHTIQGVCKVVDAFFEIADNGGAHSILLPMMSELLNMKPLSPLTNDPKEWQYHHPTVWDGTNPVWQNIRSGDAFSLDGGKTYWLVNEKSPEGERVIHTSAPMKLQGV